MKKFYKEDGEALPSVVFVEEGTQQPGFSLLVDDAEIREALSAIYKKRAADGYDMFKEFRLDLASKFQSGELNIADAHFIESKLSATKSFLLSGDWATAKYEMEQTLVEGSYTEELKTSLLSIVESYVLANY